MQLFDMPPHEPTLTRVTATAELAIGDMIATGTHAHDGRENYAVVTKFGVISDGVYAVFCQPHDRHERRLPSDRDFFIWDFELERGNVRRVE